MERRLGLWGKGEIQELLQEGQAIQRRLVTGRAHTIDFKAGDMSRRFAGFMSRGDVKAAIALLDSDDRSGAPMGLDMPLVSEDPSWTVCDELLRKHPKGQPACSAALKSLDGCGESFHPVIFEALDGALIRNAALRTRGAAGPLDWMLLVGDASVLPFSGLPMICAVLWLWLLVSSVHLVLTRMVSLPWLLVV